MVTLSIVIPVYNGERFIEQTIRSVINQPCKDIEIIVVDDGSTDDTAAIVSALQDKHSQIHLYTIPNRGVAGARNYGVRQASGVYVSFLDADDVYCKNVYSESVRDVLQLKQYDVLKYGYIIGSRNLQRGNILLQNDEVITKKHASFNSFFKNQIASYVFKKELIEGKIFFPEGLRYGEDMIFLFLCSIHSKNILLQKKPIFVYRDNEYSTVHTINIVNARWEELLAWQQCIENCRTSTERLNCYIRIAEYMVRYVKNALEKGISSDDIKRDLDNNSWLMSTFESVIDQGVHISGEDIYFKLINNSLLPDIWYRLRVCPKQFINQFRRASLGKAIYDRYRYKSYIKDYID